VDDVVRNGGVGLAIFQGMSEGGQVRCNVAVQLLVRCSVIRPGKLRGNEDEDRAKYDQQRKKNGRYLPE
jgi:hypothetical protein